ncbi:hypothetical protein [Sphingomonas metalli]|nr:hypothetical protein [Sphingomonas metalli]
MGKGDHDEALEAFGRYLMQDPDYPDARSFLYARMEPGAIAECIYKDLGNHILFRWPKNSDLSFALLDYWEAQPGPERWAELEYVLRDGRFDVAYIYPDQIDPDEELFVRSQRALRRHFGDKPIGYPSLDDENDDSVRFDP